MLELLAPLFRAGMTEDDPSSPAAQLFMTEDHLASTAAQLSALGEFSLLEQHLPSLLPSLVHLSEATPQLTNQSLPTESPTGQKIISHSQTVFREKMCCS